jgi:hypothetical protein|tara:strand:+ start:146 stop:385 length:240 start_codon:yes stop_codon:yes gene_type:complete
MKKRDRTNSWTTQSRFGSHSSMVVEPNEIDQWNKNMNVRLEKDEVLCEDDEHYYITKKNRLDTGMADPNRYGKKVIFSK